MKIPKLREADGVVWYTPDFLENLELPREQRAAIGILPLTTGEHKDRFNVTKLLAKKFRKQSQLERYAIEKNEEAKRELLKSNVVGVRNWKDEADDGTEIEIKSWDELLARLDKRGFGGLVPALEEKVYQAIRGQSELDEVLAGESMSSPASP